MCGIVGIVKLNQRETVDEARLKRMRDVLRHRGPDGEGLWIEGPVGLGMRRLAIVDVAGGRQPMANEDGTVWIVYNGEVYNHADLRPELEQRGHRYRTRSDTETILHLYEENGERCVERLQGMFAFALWDQKRRRLLLARDRLGIKPLYYAWTDHELVFASEIKAILAGGSVRPALHESSPGRRPSSAGCASFCRGGPSHGHAPRGPGNAATGGCLPLPTARPGRSRPAGARCVPGSRRLSGATS